MTGKLKQMVALIKKLTIGQTIPVRGFNGEVMAFNDEGVFVTVKVPPEEFEGTAKEMVVKDSRVESLQREVRELRNEIDKMLDDRGYYQYRRERMEREQRWKRDQYDRIRMDAGMMMSPRYTGIYGGGEFSYPQPMPDKVKQPMWVDPLTYKEPSQRKR